MNLKELEKQLNALEKLSDDELRVRCAELRGWVKMAAPKHVYFYYKDKGKHFPKGATPVYELPNYPADLNACAEFEKGLNPRQGYQYHGHLQTILQLWMLSNEDEQGWLSFYVTTATPRQRTIAYVLTESNQ